MLTPEQLDRFPAGMVELYAQLERDILADMARRISTYDYFIPSAEWQFKKQKELGNLNSEIIKKLSQVTGKSEAELKRLMSEAGAEALTADDKIYKAAGKEPIPANQSKALLAVLNANYKKTSSLFKNLTKTTAQTATGQFEAALDRAHLQILSGAFDSNTAVRNAIKDLCRQGVGAVEYPSGHIDTLETAVRRATLTGINQTCAELQLARAEEMECDLVETSAHAGARPEHEAWQGRVFSLSGSHKKYPDFYKSTGYGSGEGLCGWNCRHNFSPFFEGISEPAYTKDDLEDYKAKKYNYNGVEMTEYEASQKQRYIERQQRRWKRENIAMQAAGLDTTESAAKIARWSDIEKDFCRQTGLKRQVERSVIYGERTVKGLKKSRKNDTIKLPNLEIISNARQRLVDAKVEYLPVKLHKSKLTTAQIVDRLGGGDMTKGSCSSLAFAYAGNRNGLDVLDFRGGMSQWVFSLNSSIVDIANLPNVKGIVEKHSNDYKAANKLLKTVKEGKEYYLATGKHAAIIRKTKSCFEYLELQSATDNGFKKLTKEVLRYRFGCQKQHTFHKMKLEIPNILIDLDSLRGNKEFEKLLGYINTAEKAQQKGVMGNVK